MCSKDVKPLNETFIGIGEVKGYMFTQLEKSDKAYVYEVSSADAKHYEVFKHKINKRYSCVSYPTSNGFGIWSWTFMTLAAALEKFNQLNAGD